MQVVGAKMNDMKLKHQLTEAAKRARYLSQSGRGIRGFADHHVEAFVTVALPMVKQLLEVDRRHTEELSRAIECLPKPQEGMGGSASERVANVIFLLQKAREGRAEVLAACIARLTPLREKLDLLLCDEDLTDEKLREASEGLLPSLADAIRFLRKLQPAASDLEEHDKELLFERDVEWTLAVLGDTDTCHEPKSAAELLDTDSNTLHGIIESLHKKIAELEKARAILGELKR